MAFPIFGGIHPKDNKWLAKDHPVQEFPEPDVVVIPMSQHIGVPCLPLVKKGDMVLMGQKIGDNQGLCVPVHASVSGKVKAVEMRPHSSGTTAMSVVIESDHRQTLHPNIRPRPQEVVDALSPQELIDIIREAGIIGMGGAAFPTHVKLNSGLGKVDTIIINLAECEPFITADDRLCRENPWDVLSGIRILQRILGLDKAYIGMEDNKPEAAKALRKAIAGKKDIKLEILHTKYPQGAEKQLVQESPAGRSPPAACPPL